MRDRRNRATRHTLLAWMLGAYRGRRPPSRWRSAKGFQVWNAVRGPQVGPEWWWCWFAERYGAENVTHVPACTRAALTRAGL